MDKFKEFLSRPYSVNYASGREFLFFQVAELVVVASAIIYYTR